MDFDAWVGVPVVELVAVLIEDGGDLGAVAVLGFAHEGGADVGEEIVGSVEEIDLGTFDVDFDEVGWGGVFEQPVEGDAKDFVGVAGAAGLRVFGHGREMVGVAIAVGDVEGGDAGAVADGDGHDVDASGGGRLEGCGALQQGGEPEVGFDGDDAALGAGFLRGGDGEEADVCADVPEGVAGFDELAGEVEEIGLEAGLPVMKAGVGRDKDRRSAEVLGEMLSQDAVAADFFGEGPEGSHCYDIIAKGLALAGIGRWVGLKAVVHCGERRL